MKLSDFPSVGSCWPFEYDVDPTTRGSRIGGSPPKGAVPHFDTPQQKYFGTIAFDDGQSVSIFYSLDKSGEDEERDVISFNNQVLYPSELIHAVVHESGVPNDESKISSEVTCHRLAFRIVIPDQDADFPETNYPFSKLGGRPFVENRPRVGGAFEALAVKGFRQLAQFDTPNPSKASFVDGFPWDPGWLHVFVRRLGMEDFEFAFVIQQ